MSSARRLTLVDRVGTRHSFVYCGNDCVAYRMHRAGVTALRARLSASVEVWRLAFHEFGCMDWAVYAPDEFDKLLPTLRITT